jgi:hypothetical protein
MREGDFLLDKVSMNERVHFVQSYIQPEHCEQWTTGNVSKELKGKPVLRADAVTMREGERFLLDEVSKKVHVQYIHYTLYNHSWTQLHVHSFTLICSSDSRHVSAFAFVDMEITHLSIVSLLLPSFYIPSFYLSEFYNTWDPVLFEVSSWTCLSDIRLQPKRKCSHARFCARGSCGRSGNETSLHKFPSDVCVARKWSEFVNQDRTVPDHSGSRICTYHFHPMSYTDP